MTSIDIIRSERVNLKSVNLLNTKKIAILHHKMEDLCVKVNKIEHFCPCLRQKKGILPNSVRKPLIQFVF